MDNQKNNVEDSNQSRQSVFDGDDQTENVNPTNEGANTDSPVELLVGEGRKFKTVEDLARGKIEADNYIPKLEQDLKEVQSRLKVYEDLVERGIITDVKNSNSGTPPLGDDSNGSNTNKQEGAADIKTLTEEDLDRILDQRLSAREKALIQEQNLKSVENELLQANNGNTQKVFEQLKQAAKDLDMTVGELKVYASTNPRAFRRLVGLASGSDENQQTRPNSSRAPESDQRIGSGSGIPDSLSTYSGIQKRRKELDSNPTRANQRESKRLENLIYKLSSLHGREWLKT